MRARRFEDLVVWQKARELANRIYEITRREPFSKDFRLVSQVRDAARSVMANVAEGFERRSKNEFHQGVVCAKGSAGELRSDLHLALDQKYISPEEHEDLVCASVEISRLLEALRAEIDRQRRTS